MNRRRVLGAVLGAVALVLPACSGGSDNATANAEEPTGPTIPADPIAIQDASATAMGDVTSVRFELDRSGAPIFIDRFESLSLEHLLGRFSAPKSAEALIDVQVNGSLNTQLGAIALDDEVWLSNPVTGVYEPLPAGYDLDPSNFFDPVNGWRPLMAGLTGVELIGTADRGGDRYHIRGTAPAAQVADITAGLVRNQDVVADFWIHPVTALVTTAEFTTVFGDEETTWLLDLSEYGETFEISPPPDASAEASTEG